MKIALINHGCPKNLVDSELMSGFLAQKGHDITLNPEDAQIVIVNTCSFIHDAEVESVDSILEMAGEGKKVIVTGCLAQKYKDELKVAMPEISGIIGVSELDKISDIVDEIQNSGTEKYISKVSAKPEYIYPESVERQQITVGAGSYIKIADGCNYHCGYCIIPQLRGAYHSRPMENIIDEAKSLAAKGVTEIILIAQDTTSYGLDLYGKLMLPELLKRLNEIENISWIRFMYAYPSQVTDELLGAMANLDKVVKYLDLPLQHADLEVLRSMRRPDFDYGDLIRKIRLKVPNIAIRTAFIVGYPGETEEQFMKLYDFVKEMRFDRMGVFEYSREKNTISYDMSAQVPDVIKKERYNKLMSLQMQISTEINRAYVGKTINCIVEGFTDDGVVILRSEHDAPEIDGLVYAACEKTVIPGDIEKVKIEKSDEYDLFGVIA